MCVTGYWKKSAINHAIFCELTIYILFTLLLLPTLGFVSVYHFCYFLAQLLTGTIDFAEMTEVTPQWFCIFLPQGGRFYATYMITTALTGNMLGIFRAGDWARFVWRLVKARSWPGGYIWVPRQLSVFTLTQYFYDCSCWIRKYSLVIGP